VLGHVLEETRKVVESYLARDAGDLT